MGTELGESGRRGESWSATAEVAGLGVRAEDRWRDIRTLGANGVRTSLPDGRPVVQFASNDYLGLSGHPSVIAASVAATEQWGTGSGASRLVVGSRPVHDELEAALAEWKHSEAALLFASGYAANVGVVGALTRLGEATGRPIAVVSDALNHASIIDGTRQARVPVSVYAHNDVEAARAAIVEHGAAGRRSVIVTDSVFSMDGDVAPLFELAELAQATGALLVVDDAHAVFAAHGADALTSSDAEILIVGTLSKALGSLGGFVAGPRSLVDWCRNTARSFIFSTASPPSVVAAALAALAVVRSEEGSALTAALRANVDALLPGHVSAVVPVVLGEERRALDVSAALLERGLLVPAIRPPTVAVGASRLRIAVSAAHTPTEVAELIAALGALGVTLDAEVAA